MREISNFYPPPSLTTTPVSRFCPFLFIILYLIYTQGLGFDSRARGKKSSAAGYYEAQLSLVIVTWVVNVVTLVIISDSITGVHKDLFKFGCNVCNTCSVQVALLWNSFTTATQRLQTFFFLLQYLQSYIINL